MRREGGVKKKGVPPFVRSGGRSLHGEREGPFVRRSDPSPV